MKKTRNNIITIISMTALCLLFTACGGDSGGGGKTTTLPECTGNYVYGADGRYYLSNSTDAAECRKVTNSGIPQCSDSAYRDANGVWYVSSSNRVQCNQFKTASNCGANEVLVRVPVCQSGQYDNTYCNSYGSNYTYHTNNSTYQTICVDRYGQDVQAGLIWQLNGYYYFNLNAYYNRGYYTTYSTSQPIDLGDNLIKGGIIAIGIGALINALSN